MELRTQTRELYKHGVKPKLRPQAYQLLALLLERAGDAITREELLKRIWPSDTFVDFEHGLNTAINELRGTLSDSASEPRYIETLPKLGYRVISPVEAVAGVVAGVGVKGAGEKPEPAVAGSSGQRSRGCLAGATWAAKMALGGGARDWCGDRCRFAGHLKWRRSGRSPQAADARGRNDAGGTSLREFNRGGGAGLFQRRLNRGDDRATGAEIDRIEHPAPP